MSLHSKGNRGFFGNLEAMFNQQGKVIALEGAKKHPHRGLRGSQLVQGDGEVIGHTPVEVELVPKAIRVIMPIPSKG